MIVFTEDVFIAQRLGGISRYFVEIACELVALGVDIRVEAGRYLNLHLRDATAADATLAAHTAGSFCKGDATLRRRVCRNLSAAVRGGGYGGAVVHRTYYPLVETARRGRLVTTVHDMIDERFGGGARDRLQGQLKRRSALAAARVVAVSASTKRDMVDFWGMAPERITVIHHGVRLTDPPPMPAPVSGPFLLHVGRRDGYKNFVGLLTAFAWLAPRHPDLRLVVIGGGDLQSSELANAKRLGVGDRLLHRQANDIELAGYYRDAAAFVFASRYEGFGIPVLEAMAQGCPVACATGSSLDEIAGTAAVTFDPTEPEAIAAAVETVLQDTDLRRRLRRDGRAHAATFTWRRSAEQHLAVYRSLAPA